MAGGGSGELRTIQVRFTVEPVLMYKSGPPTISVIGSTFGDGGEREKTVNLNII